jgi:ketosteroid isomerase-like protein
MRFTFPAVAAVLLAACAPKPETPEQTAARLKAETDSARVAIEAQDARIVKFIAAAQPDSVASIYAQDAVLYAKDMPATRGRAAIASQWRTWMALGSYAYKVTTTSVEASGSIAVETGRSDVTFTPGPKAPRGTKAATFSVIYVTTWRKVGGQWLISNDIGTSDQPAQPTPAKRD